MNTPTSILEQARWRIGAAGRWREVVIRVRDRVMPVGRAAASMMGPLRTRPGGLIRANRSESVNSIKRGACVLALVLLFSTVGVGGKSDPDASTAGLRVVPIGTIAPATAAPSPEPSADGRNDDTVTVTPFARFKAH